MAKNTLALYFRMLFTMFVSLYTSRVVLNALGVSDFGVYNVVGGMVAIFSFLNGTMSAATQRFLSYAIGKGDNEQLMKIFNMTIFIHICIALVILILGETIAVWFLNYKMNIPPNRIDAANWVLHFSVISIAINVIQVPYNAMIIAQEKMKIYAYFSIAEATLKLLYNPQIQISAESETKRSIFREKDKTKRSKKESAQHSKSRNKSFVMTSVSAL